MRHVSALYRRITNAKERAFYEKQGSRLTEADHERDFPDEVGKFGQPWRKGVCRRCHCVMVDQEPLSSHGEFYHPDRDKNGKPHWCPNTGICFTTRNTELMPFMSKARRRALKRMGIRP